MAGEALAALFNAFLIHVKVGMPSLAVGDVYIHPDANSSVAPHLKAHLPYSSTELYVVQVPPAPDSTVFATFPPTESPSKSGDWSVGVLGITGTPQTEFWFWSSAEGAPTINVDEDGEDHFQSAYAQFERMLKLISKMHPKKETLRVGSLHHRIAYHIPQTIPREVQRIAVFNNLVFSKDSLPPPDSRTQVIGLKYIFKEVAVEDLDDVVETSTVVRIKASLAATSSTGAYLASSEDRRAQAWSFISREGAISSVYVRPEVRRMGLGKETMKKELEKGFVFRKFIIAHVFPTNTTSLGLCQSLGARRTSDVIWITVLLN